MLGGGPHVALRHRPTLASVGAIVAERLPNDIKTLVRGSDRSR